MSASVLLSQVDICDKNKQTCLNEMFVEALSVVDKSLKVVQLPTFIFIYYIASYHINHTQWLNYKSILWPDKR